MIFQEVSCPGPPHSHPAWPDSLSKFPDLKNRKPLAFSIPKVNKGRTRGGARGTWAKRGYWNGLETSLWGGPFPLFPSKWKDFFFPLGWERTSLPCMCSGTITASLLFVSSNALQKDESQNWGPGPAVRIVCLDFLVMVFQSGSNIQVLKEWVLLEWKLMLLDWSGFTACRKQFAIHCISVM